MVVYYLKFILKLLKKHITGTKLHEKARKKKNINSIITTLEAGAQSCSMKKVFLEISQNSQENTCTRVSF